MRAAATVVPTVGREGRSEAASAPLGPLVKVPRTVHSNENRVIFWMEIFFEKKKRWNFKAKVKEKLKIEHEKGSDTDF
jgi:hypothetical protein